MLQHMPDNCRALESQQMPGKHAMVRSEAVVCSALRLYDSLLAAQCCRGYHGAAAADKRLARAAAVYLTMSGIPVHHSL